MWSTNITGLDREGSFRSLNGAADESIFIGRASKAGLYCFFKVWRDMPYDAVLEYNRVLFRVEVKGTTTNSINVTRGSRSGAQIDRGAENRTRVIAREDCDFVVGVYGSNGDCYVIPTDIIEVLNKQSLSLMALEPYKEKWHLFMGGRLPIDLTIARDGLMGMSIRELRHIATQLEITIPAGPIRPRGTRGLLIEDEKEKLVLLIWGALADNE